MKKRIIGMILVVVMLTLSLVSCGYSFKDDDMSKYATLSEADKAAFNAALSNILIKDGDFIVDEAVRSKQVMDYVYSTIMSTKGTDTETTGIPGAHDKIYYYYYMTAVTASGEEITFGLNNMQSASNLILGLSEYDDDKVKEAIAANFVGFKLDRVYGRTTSGKTYEGDKAYVSYTYSYTVKEGEADVVKTEKVVNKLLTVAAKPAENAAPATLESYLCEKDIGKDITKIDITDAEKGKVTYSDIKINWVARTTSGNTIEGDKAYVTGSYTYKVTEGDKEVEKTVSIDKLVSIAAKPAEGAAASSLESYLCGKEIGTVFDEFELADAEKGTLSYKNVKVNWIMSSTEPSFKFQDLTYTEEKKFTDVNNKSVDVKDLMITYHIFAEKYVVTPEFTAENLLDLYYAENLTADNMYALILGIEWAGLDEDDDKEKIEERANLIKEHKTAEGDDLDTFVTKLLKYYDDITDAETAHNNATKEAENAQKSLENAEAALASNTDASKAEELQKAVETANKNLVSANDEKTKAFNTHENYKTEKNNYIKSFLATEKDGVTFDAKITDNFKKRVYSLLQENYNEEIRMNLATEIYYLLTKDIVLTGKLPEKAVKMAYESMMENYETDFYTGNVSSSGSSGSNTSQSNYSFYKTFEKFLIAKVTADHKTVTTYKEAKEVLMEKAKEYVEPIVKIYLIADLFDLEMTDKEFKEYKKDPDSNYSNKVYNAGENSVKHAYQLDKILNHFLKYEESEEVLDGNGNKVIEYKYEKVVYSIGEPVSETDKKDDTKN